jgi:riboflavin kinase/FMN adenylyltransferase
VRYLVGTPNVRRPAVLAIGDFDGVSEGHLHLASRAMELSAAHGVPAVLVVTWPGMIAEGAALTALDERLELLEANVARGDVVVLPLSHSAGAEGIDARGLGEILDAWYDVRGLVALSGGHAAPMWDALRAVTAAHGWELRDVAVGEDQTTDVASLIVGGEVARAARLLGHPYQVRGRVALGDRRGRLLGFPTANLRPDPRKVLPATGVYAVRVRLPGEATAVHAGVANIGVRPTFGDGRAPLVEVHLLDLELDLYELELVAELVERLRAEQRFSGVDALKAQIASDAQHARVLLAGGDASTVWPGTPR